jgi:cytoskeleton protein RodZ
LDGSPAPVQVGRRALFGEQERLDLLHDRKARLTEGYAMLSSADRLDSGRATSEEGIGPELRLARERLGWALPDVAAMLRIRLVYLEAIESGRFSDLPGSAYALGFVRSYANALGLDVDEVARRFRGEAVELSGRTQLEFPAPVPERGVPAGAVVLLGGLLAVGTYIGWYRMSGQGPSTVVVQMVPDRLASLAEPPHPPPPPPVVVVPPPVAPAAAAQQGWPTYPPISAGAAMPPPSFSLPAPELPAPPAPVINGAADARIIVRAKVDSWIQVRDKAGQTLFNRVLRPGESYNVPPRQALLLTVGNAGGVDMLVDGVVAPSIGGVGVVRRDLPLDPDAIRGGKLPAQKATNF